MIDAKRQQMSGEKEHATEKHNPKNNGSKIKNNKASAFAAALAQGIIPQTQGEDVFGGLSQLGNSAFLRAVERAKNRDDRLKPYVIQETFSPSEQAGLTARLAAEPSLSKTNTVEHCPEVSEEYSLPDPLLGTMPFLSHLGTVSFDHEKSPSAGQISAETGSVSVNPWQGEAGDLS